MIQLLFICGKNKWRSPTAEHIFADLMDPALNKLLTTKITPYLL
jgi:predicted protein tyrosine phosphatase